MALPLKAVNCRSLDSCDCTEAFLVTRSTGTSTPEPLLNGLQIHY